MIFQGLSVARSCLRPETVPLTAALTLLLYLKEKFCAISQKLLGTAMGHSGTDLKFLITIEF